MFLLHNLFGRVLTISVHCHKRLFACLVLFSCAGISFAFNFDRYIGDDYIEGDFILARSGRLAPICVDPNEDTGILRVVSDVQKDIQCVTGQSPSIMYQMEDAGNNVVLIGTLGKSRIIDALVKDDVIDASPIAGKWESFLVEVVSKPVPGIEKALVIAGSDKRGTIYALYDISEQIGVSPWHWWADVPVQPKDNLFVKAGRYVQGPPAVQYRGIFLNDEAPALSNWVYRNFGNYKHEFYVKVFELILRLKGNFLWPAMWNNSFNTDDPLNPKLAHEYGIVMSTSHHEPMMRAWKEWEWAGHKKGSWDYSKNADILHEFWEEGVRRTCNYEKIITLGMRGDGDEPMSEEANIALLEKIVTDQRKIIVDVINPDLSSVPQVWALYKEVQGYYERGMRVPDDVILLWCDDNWGNVRRLPTPEERMRSGGAGMYYHFDYVGGPRSYKWINTNPIPKIWEQMNLTYHYDANRIWIVNVGDLKPMEFPIEFFLTLAWNPERWPKEKIPAFTRLWCERQFGPQYAEAAAELITGYTRFNGRRKPELLDPDFYSHIHYREAEIVMQELGDLTAKAERVYRQLPDNAKDAFFQLVLHPVKATAIVNELYSTVGRNRLYARQKRAAANELAEQARRLFQADADLTRYYHEEMAGGKWRHMMDQTHIGYRTWDQPRTNVMPDVVEIELSDAADMGVAVEGSDRAWPEMTDKLILPEFSVFTQDKHYIDIFNKGKKPFSFTAASAAPWVKLSQTEGTVDKETRLWVSMDWDNAPIGSADAAVKIAGTDQETTVRVRAFKPAVPRRDSLDGFVEAGGYVSIEAEYYTRKVDTDAACWEKIPEYGHTLSAMSIFPVTAASVQPPEDAPYLEYRMYLFDPGKVEVHAVVAPTLNFVPDRGLRCALSFNDEAPQIIELVPQGFNADNGVRDWETAVWNNMRTLKSTHTLSGTGYHTLKFRMVDPGVVLQKLIVDTGGLKPSYLGPPPSYFNKPKGAVHTGRWRNLFVEVGYCPDEVAAKVKAAFEQLFCGDPKTQAVYYPDGRNEHGPLAYILDVNNNDVRSEGVSYGMMIAVQMDKKAEFDALWNWAKTHMHHDAPDHPAHGYFAWSVKTDGTPNDEMPAPDGEAYFATALYFADGRWGSGEGIYDYRVEADRLLTDMLHRQSITGQTVTGRRTAVNLFDKEHKMIRFTPDLEAADRTDPSYHLPAFLELWALWGPEKDRPFWSQAAAASRDFFERTAHPVTGLSPEYANFDGSPWAAPWKPDSVHFQFDAWRTAMNWAFDWAWWAKDPRAVERSDRIQTFFESQGMDTYVGQYTLSGEAFGKEQNTGVVAANAVVSLAASRPRAEQFVRAFWNRPIPTGRYRYYDGMLYMMGLLHCSGNFRVWSPQIN